MNSADRDEIKGIMKALAKRCRNTSLREELLNCLDKGCWEATLRCCTVHLDGYRKRSLTPGDATEGLLHSQVGVAHLMLGQTHTAIEQFTQAHANFQIHDSESRGLVGLMMGRAYAELNDNETASTCYREAIDLLATAKNPLAERARTWRFALLANRPSTTASDPFALLAEAENDRFVAEFYKEQGDLASAIDHLHDAIRLLEPSGQKKPLLDAYLDLGDIYEQQQVWGEARTTFEAALRIALALEMPETITAVKAKLGRAVQEVLRERAEAEAKAKAEEEERAKAAEGGTAAKATAEEGAPDANKADTAETKAEPYAPAPRARILPFKLQVSPMLAERIAAGKGLTAWEITDSMIEVGAFVIDGEDYGVREIFTGPGDLNVGSFDHAVRITGQSMEPTLYNGEVALARRADAATDNDICVVRIPDGDEFVAVVKRHFARSNHVLLQSDNPDHPWLILLREPDDEAAIRQEYEGRTPVPQIKVYRETEARVISRVVAVMARLDDGGFVVPPAATPSPAAATAPS